MTKVTSPGWPDPTSWAKSLMVELAERKPAYDTSDDIHVRQIQLAGIINTIVKHLHMLPAIEEHHLAQPLMHIVDALRQAEQGHKPVLFTNRKVSPARKASIYWLAAKRQAVLCYFTLAASRHGDPAGFVAEQMNLARLARRKGEQQSADSIRRIVDRFETDRKADDAEEWIKAASEELREYEGNPLWPVPLADALDYTRRVFRSEKLRPFFS